MKKLTTKVQVLYALGVSYAIVDQIFAQWILYFYLPSESSGLKPFMAPVLVSIALAISRLVDMVTDPLVGFLSDKYNSKYGRRIPFVAVGTIPLILVTIALLLVDWMLARILLGSIEAPEVIVISFLAKRENKTTKINKKKKLQIKRINHSSTLTPVNTGVIFYQDF